MFTATTHNVKITVHPVYLEGQSIPDQEHFVWAYTVVVENFSEAPVRLLKRYWHITDAMGRVQEVRGDGVIGEQPKIAPSERYQYTSGVALHTSSGVMRGEYEMQTEDGISLVVEIPLFSLDSPQQTQRAN